MLIVPFAILVGLGATFGMLRVSQSVPTALRLSSARMALWVLLGAFLGARIGFFFWQPAYVAKEGWQALHFWEGGLIWSGAILGALTTLATIAIIRKIDFRQLMDIMAPLLPPLAIMTWLGCLTSNCGYGKLVEDGASWLQVDGHFPNQIFAALSLAFIYSLFERFFTINKPGVRSAWIWLIFCLHTLFFSYLRADLRPMWKGYPYDVWASAAFVLLTLFYLVIVLLIVRIPKERIEQSAI